MLPSYALLVFYGANAVFGMYVILELFAPSRVALYNWNTMNAVETGNMMVATAVLFMAQLTAHVFVKKRWFGQLAAVCAVTAALVAMLLSDATRRYTNELRTVAVASITLLYFGTVFLSHPDLYDKLKKSVVIF